MVTELIRFVQITATTDHIFGLDEEGVVYYREKPSFVYSTAHAAGYGGASYQKKDEAEEKKVWKKCLMEYKVELPKGGAEREAQPGTEDGKPAQTALEVVVDEPARKVYKDTETVKRVQQALKDKGIYKDTYKIDGDLGHLTIKAIKEYQKSLSLKEDGEIDFNLWNALGLNASNEQETIIELKPELKPEEDLSDVEIFAGA